MKIAINQIAYHFSILSNTLAPTHAACAILAVTSVYWHMY